MCNCANELIDYIDEINTHLVKQEKQLKRIADALEEISEDGIYIYKM